MNRLDWQRRAASIGAYRELSGHHHPAEPIGPESVTSAPDIRAAWHEALAALGPADGPDVRGMPDGMLLHLRDTYPIETAWAPAWVGDELRQVRTAAREAHLAAIRASAEAEAARQRGQHEQATRQQRQLAVAADTELRRRHPDQRFAPLRSAEPQPATQAQRDELTLTAGEELPQLGQWIKDLAAQHCAFADRLAERQSLMIPAEDPDCQGLGPAFPAWTSPGKDAILQPPKPRIQPSTQILEQATGRDLDIEAVD